MQVEMVTASPSGTASASNSDDEGDASASRAIPVKEFWLPSNLVQAQVSY